MTTVWIVFILTACKKGENFIDNTSQYPLGWKSTDSFPIVAYNVKDTLGSIVSIGTGPLGVTIDPIFGKMQAAFYVNFQTTLSSASFSYSNVDSIILILPFNRSIPKYGSINVPMDVLVYEMTEGIEATIDSKKDNYSYNPTLVGSLTNFIPNTTDSIVDGATKSGPGLRIPLSMALANRIIGGGPYADDASFQAILKGLYIKTSDNNTNGYLMISQTSNLKLRIYGKNNSGDPIASDFVTGSNNSTTVNQFRHDNSSIAAQAANTADKINGDAKLYNAGIYGYYSKLRIPNLVDFAKTKNIFKAELTIFALDTGLRSSASFGLTRMDSFTKRELPIKDEQNGQNYVSQVKDTMIAGSPVRMITYNIGMQLTYLANQLEYGNEFNLYSAPIVIGANSTISRLTDFIPSKGVLGGKMQPFAPKLTLYYVDK